MSVVDSSPSSTPARRLPKHIKLFSKWMYVVAATRCFAMYLAFFNQDRLRTNLYNLEPAQVTPLHARLFGSWTLLTNFLAILCGTYPTNEPLYIGTLMSFGVAIFHFTTEALIFKTLSLSSAMGPMVFAVPTSMWMLASWYPKYAAKQAKEQQQQQKDKKN